jgi:hypothetical protein
MSTMNKYRNEGEKEYTFSYNSPNSVQSPNGTKQTWITANNKIEAREKIMKFLSEFNGELCIEFF